MKVSYCTTCKNRLWQLSKTIFFNMQKINLSDDAEMILIDYQSNDGLKEFIIKNFQKDLDSGKLKYFKAMHSHDYFYMSHAKNIAHCMATGEVLFNLDADNYIGIVHDELLLLKEKTLLVDGICKEDRGGRIGVSKVDYMAMRGYSEILSNYEDMDFVLRCKFNGYHIIKSKDQTLPIPNSREEKFRFIKDIDYKKEKIANEKGFGLSLLVDHLGNHFDSGVI